MSEIVKVCGIEISNPEKIINKNIKKIDVIKYYQSISSRLLPFVCDRPVAEVRCHNGFECFFKKHPYQSKKLISVVSKKDLINEVQQGTIEFHPYANKTDTKKPNIMVFDLDPDEKLPHKKLAESVLLLKHVLDKLGLVSFLKTSGGKGYHVVVPFKETKNFKKFENFAKDIAILLEKTHPSIFTTNIRKVERKGKIFIDYLRNKNGSTCVAPYSLRARENLPISFPIAWSDIFEIKPNQITINNYQKYINNSWQNFFKIKQSLV